MKPHDPTPSEPDGLDDLVEYLNAGDDKALAARFRQRTVTIEPGQRLDYVASDWTGALVIIDDGTLEIEGVSGHRYPFGREAILHLTDLPVRALRNVGPNPAVVTAISRRNRHDARDTTAHPAAQQVVPVALHDIPTSNSPITD